MATPPKKSNSPHNSHKTTTYEKLGDALAGAAARILAAAAPRPEADPAPRATMLLVHQHRKVEELLDRLKSRGGDVETALAEMADDLSAHLTIEEELFYPAVRALDTDIILEGLEEHAMGRFALKRLLATKASDEALSARISALAELMKNHHREEENDLFPKVHRAMSKSDLEALGASMKKRFDDCVERGHQAALAAFHDEPRKPGRSKSAKPRRPTTRTTTRKKKTSSKSTRS